MSVSGAKAFLDLLADFGVSHFFSNPGSTELPLNDLLVDDSRFRYVLGLHEIAVMSMADGYAMASRSLGVVNLHICCGVGNAMGMLYNAHCEGTPLLVTAGQQDRRLLLGEPVLAGEMVSVVRPWTKCAVEVNRIEDLPSVVRRAVQVAMSPPTGPVFISLPVDLQMEESDRLDLTPIRLPDFRTRPPVSAIEEVLLLLKAARRPAILAGSRVTESGAIDALVEFAETVGAPVFYESATSHGRLPFPPDHPLCLGPLALWSPDVCEQLDGFDSIIAIGINLLRLYIHFEPATPFPEGATRVHLDQDSRQIGKTFPVDAGLVGDIHESLSELTARMRADLESQRQEEIRARMNTRKLESADRRGRLEKEIEAQSDHFPLTPLALMGRIARWLPEDAAVIEEAVTTTANVLERLGAITRPDGYFAHRGWALGWGIGCALGVKMAWPDRPVVALIGDGAAMYGIQSLWTAAKYRIRVTFVICNNRNYKILKDCASVLELKRAAEGRFIGMDLDEPAIDFVKLAESMGVVASRPSDVDQLDQALQRSLVHQGPTLIEVAVAN